MSYFKLEKRGHVAILTLDRPDVLNALDHSVYVEWHSVLDEIERDDDLYVLIFTGSGRAFIAGANIAALRDTTAMESVRDGQEASALTRRLETFKKPVIAAINGYALGGGGEIALACDIRLASDRAKFGFPEVSLGIIAGDGCTQLLARTVGVAKAAELTFTGRVFDAEEALRIGMISYVYPHEELMDRAVGLAEEICANAQIAVQQTKKVLRAGLEVDRDSGCALEVQANAVCFATEDKYEGTSAFLEKRDKNFRYR